MTMTVKPVGQSISPDRIPKQKTHVIIAHYYGEDPCGKSLEIKRGFNVPFLCPLLVCKSGSAACVEKCEDCSASVLCADRRKTHGSWLLIIQHCATCNS